MTEIQKAINTAFDLISGIPVTGDAQERAAMAKEHLRKAYKLAEAKEEGQDDRRAGRRNSQRIAPCAGHL